jgi:DHA1 family multidrug resistance protein-like MFS transporter
VTQETPLARIPAWLDRWGPILPLLIAEFIVWLGFGGLLPVLPLYFTEQGLDLATLGLVIAAWPIARLVTEPVFGWLADRTARVPWMLAGLLLTGVFEMLPLFVIGPAAFVLIRGAAGVAAAMYDPAARGYLTDATPPERRGEAFGLYGAAQMGGLLIGPAIGAIGAGMFGGIRFVFIFSAVATFLGAAFLAWRVKEPGVRTHPAPSFDATEFPRDTPSVNSRAATDVDAGRFPNLDPDAPRRLLNRGLIATLVLNAGGYYAGGTYEVIWSLFLRHLGAGLDLIGLTFAMFGLPVLLLSPFAGRLVDRRGSYLFIIIGCLIPAVVGICYTLIVNPLLAVPLIVMEATGFAMLNPALYSVVAANSPPGRSSTAQGLFGAAGTVGFIVASLVAGVLAASDIVYPFYVFSAVMLVSLVLGLAVGGTRLRVRPAARAASAADVAEGADLADVSEVGA